MDLDLTGRVFVVSGGSRGRGRDWREPRGRLRHRSEGARRRGALRAL